MIHSSFEYSIRRLAVAGACLLSLFASRPTHAQSRSYTTISAVDVTPLSNGLQISIKADGILQYRDADLSGLKMHLYFPDARNGTGKNFFNINRYPVSYLQLSTPQGAASGIGLNLDISNLNATNASVSTGSDGQSVLLTIQSNRTVEGGGRGGAAGAGVADTGTKPDTSTQVLFQNGLLSLRAVKADIQGLIGEIAHKGGISVAVDDAVDRKVSLNLDGVSPEEALRDISTAYGLALSQNNGVYTLSEGVPTDLATYNASSTQSFRMQNTQAQNASGLLPNFLYSYVKVNSEQNAVVVTAPSQMLAKIGQDLKKMDVAPPQIAVEAIAVELTDSTDKDLGISFGNAKQGVFSTTDNGGTLSYSNIGNLPSSFAFNLRALEIAGKARVRARPQMAVTNGRTANLFIGAQRFILTQYNQYGQTQTRIQSVDVGVKLSVTPLTGGNGEITTRIVPEVSNITELDLQTGLPVLSSRRAETTVRVKDGETIAIGGLTLDQEQTTKSKIPFFGDLPLVGGLFRGRKKTTVRTELVIFVTPRILKNTDAAPSTDLQSSTGIAKP
jgi:type II secretory pathway component GspD/PulD (secretin)